MCNEQAQKQYGIGADAGYVGIDPNYPNFAQGSILGAQTLASVPGSKPSSDPMWMPLAALLQSYHGLRKEVDYLKIEVSRHKLRVAELEHERALRIG